MAKRLLTERPKRSEQMPLVAEIIGFKGQRPPLPIGLAVERALRLLRQCDEDLEQLRQTRAITRVRFVLHLAVAELENASAAVVAGAKEDLRDTLQAALGPDLTVGQCDGAAKMLRLLLALLDLSPELHPD